MFQQVAKALASAGLRVAKTQAAEGLFLQQTRSMGACWRGDAAAACSGSPMEA
jgi:hypothetical protein